MKYGRQNQEGFLLVSLLLVVAIIAVLALMYFKKSGDKNKSLIQNGKQGIEQTKQNNELLNQQQQQIQEQLNASDK